MASTNTANGCKYREEHYPRLSYSQGPRQPRGRAGGPPFRATQTNVVEFPGACLPQAGRIPSVFEGCGFRRSAANQTNELQPPNHLVQQLLQLSFDRTFVQLFFRFPSGTLGQERNMKRYFQRYRDDRFALTTLQNPNLEVRTYAELVQAAQQEREWQPTALGIPETQPPATPAAPDSIPSAAFCENVASAPPEPAPAAPAPLDSANSDAGNPDFTSPNSTNDDAQQILESLVADVATAGTALPSLPSSPSSDDELSAPSTPKPSHKTKKRPKTKSRRKYKDESHEPTFLERHSRKCSICRHPQRQQIDESFLHWRSPATIMHCFGIENETTIYHHAHAFNFFALRNRNLQSAPSNIVEDIDRHSFTGAEMLDAVRALAHLTADGRWIHPTSKSEVMYSIQRLPAGAGLPAAQPGLSAGACLPNRQANEPILIASPPNIKNRRKPLKTILSYSG